MAKNMLSLDAGLGDITSVLHNQGVADLSWLNVDEEEYRKFEALPKQNLDMIPELQKALTVENGDGVPSITPVRPHVIVNRNPFPLDTIAVKTDTTVPIRNRVAHLVMTGLPSETILTRLALEFGASDIKRAEPVINEVLGESGVLGNVYIDAKHFPRCMTGSNQQKFARATSACYILAKEECADCICNQNGFCHVMGGKEIVDEVPYGPKLALQHAERLMAEGRPLDLTVRKADKSFVSENEWKERLRTAFNRPPVAPRPDGVQTIHTPQRVTAVVTTAADLEAFWARRRAVTESEPIPSPAYMKYARRMMTGYDDIALLAGSEDPYLQALVSEYGLLGHTWLDMDALGGCRNTLSFIQSRNNELIASRNEGIGVVPDYVVRRLSTCSVCKGQPDGACVEISRISFIVQSRPAADKRTFVRALIRAVGTGRISRLDARMAAKNVGDKADWTLLTAQANLYYSPQVESTAVRAAVAMHACAPSSGETSTKVDAEEVRRTLSHMMNRGLTGRALQDTLLQRYSREDLCQVPEIGIHAATVDGIQGSYFIDPTAYRDYGIGCDEGARYFRKRGAMNVMASDRCAGCMLMTHPGWCSKYAKDLITQIPPAVWHAAEAARRSLPIVRPTVENPVEKYELIAELPVEIGQKPMPGPEINISSPRI
jgi:hypothetical protein